MVGFDCQLSTNTIKRFSRGLEDCRAKPNTGQHGRDGLSPRGHADCENLAWHPCSALPRQAKTFPQSEIAAGFGFFIDANRYSRRPT